MGSRCESLGGGGAYGRQTSIHLAKYMKFVSGCIWVQLTAILICNLSTLYVSSLHGIATSTVMQLHADGRLCRSTSRPLHCKAHGRKSKQESVWKCV